MRRRSPVVRRARVTDLARMMALLSQLGYQRAATDVRRDFTRLAVDANARLLVATDGGELVGMATLYLVRTLHDTGRWCRLTALVVDARSRRSGVASALLRRAETFARASACSRIEATSHAKRRDAHAFYARRGYTQLSRHYVKLLVE